MSEYRKLVRLANELVIEQLDAWLNENDVNPLDSYSSRPTKTY